MLFENSQLIIRYIEDSKHEELYDFSVDIKEFDTPNINLRFDYENEKIVSVWIDTEEDDNEPKNHVAYKLINLCRHDLSIKLKFMIEHK